MRLEHRSGVKVEQQPPSSRLGDPPVNWPTGFREEAYAAYGAPVSSARDDRTQAEPHYARRLIRRHFPSHRTARIIDLGCGDGTLLALAAREGYVNCAGTDLSPEQVRAARLRGLREICHENALTFIDRIPDGTVDVVVTMDVLEHLTRDEALRLAKGIQRVLRPSGRWLIHVPNGTSPLHGRIRYGDLTHETAYTTSSLAQLLRLAGFREFAFHEDTPVAHGLKSALRALAWRVARTAVRAFLAVETGNSGRGEVFSQNLLAIATKRPESREPSMESSAVKPGIS